MKSQVSDNMLTPFISAIETYPLIIAVDFDGTCVTHEYPGMGRSVGAEPVLKDLVDAGCKLILWTVRDKERLDDAVVWFAERDIPLWGVNSNPDQNWSTSPKVFAHLYIDDLAFGVPLCAGLPGERPFVDWKKVRKRLEPFVPGALARGTHLCDHKLMEKYQQK